MENDDLNRAYLIDIPFGRESEYVVVDFGVCFSLTFCAVSHTLPGRACST